MKQKSPLKRIGFILAREYILLWLAALAVLVFGYAQGQDRVLQLSLYDVHFSIDSFHFNVVISIYFTLLALCYWLAFVNKIKLYEWMSVLHVIVTIFGLVLLWLQLLGPLASYSMTNKTSSVNTSGVDYEILNVAFLVFLFVQFLFILNMTISYMRRQTRKL